MGVASRLASELYAMLDISRLYFMAYKQLIYSKPYIDHLYALAYRCVRGHHGNCTITPTARRHPTTLSQKSSLTQTDVAAKTQLRQATISALESGEAGTQLKTLTDVLAALDLELVVQPRRKSLPSDIEDLI